MSGQTKGKILEFLRGYPIYLLALVIVGMVTFITFMFLTTTGLIILPLYIADIQPSDVGFYFLAFAVLSGPAACIFHVFLKSMAFHIGMRTMFISYFAGNLTAAILFRLVEGPTLSVPEGVSTFIGLACTVGYAFVYWRRIPNEPQPPTANT